MEIRKANVQGFCFGVALAGEVAGLMSCASTPGRLVDEVERRMEELGAKKDELVGQLG